MFTSRSIGVFRHPLYRIAASQSCVVRLSTSRQILNTKSPGEKSDSKPYPFMTKYSDQKYDTTEAFLAPDAGTWKYQPYIILTCVTIFMVYFLILREERAVDDSIAEMMYIVMPEMEKIDLEKKIKKYKKMGLYTKHLEDRLAEVSR